MILIVTYVERLSKYVIIIEIISNKIEAMSIQKAN